tara:strand:- start:681 stop:878 length:198 start_codon:yes stop_codon:yes gene_type:complete
MSIKLEKYHYDEMLDRLGVIANIIETHLQQHHVAKVNINVKNHICNSVDELYKAIHKINNVIIKR